MYFPYIPKNISQYETIKKKSVFTAILLPIALRGNELVMEERKQMKIAFSINNIFQIERLSKKYKIKDFKKINFSTLNRSELRRIKLELLNKINIIPISLILAQSIIESGWGASRFAQEGNALFGQWTWSGDGLKPEQADENEGHKVMKFNILQASVRAYQRNLNTHKTYREFRLARAQLRDEDKELDSIILSKYLDKYAETGQEYVKILRKIIEQNNLKDFDNAKLLPSSLELESLI